jgi:predicted RNA-binding protein YlxR (DUF448 family)
LTVDQIAQSEPNFLLNAVEQTRFSAAADVPVAPESTGGSDPPPVHLCRERRPETRFSRFVRQRTHSDAPTVSSFGRKKLPRVGTRVARWFVFKPKIQIWVNLGGSCNGRGWYILWTLGLLL